MVEATIDQKAFQRAMRRAPGQLFAEMRKALVAHHGRFSLRVQRTRMSNRPGLRAPTGTMRRGLQAGTAKVSGTDLESLTVQTVFTGPHGWFAHVHEGKIGEINTIQYERGGTSITARFPARLEFRATWDLMLKELWPRVDEAVGKALA